MAGSMKKLSVSAIIPRNWRLLTVAGAATVGLACGLGKPALAELWKHSKSDSKASQTRPAENGFSATIRKLMAESRRAAEQGDQAKAIQLAERAAKISEAAAQVVGPAGECSPEETARFLAATRAGRPGTNRVATQDTARLGSAPAAPPAQALAKSTPPRPTQPSLSNSTAAAAPQETAKQPARKSAPAVAKSKEQTAAPRVAGMFGNMEGRSGRSEVADSTRSKSLQSQTETKLGVEQAKLSDSSDGLLAQSRLEAADGNLDRAIQLADQAIAAASPATLFGGDTKAGAPTEAIRWREHLISRRQDESASIVNRKSIPSPSASGSASALHANSVDAAPEKQLAITSTDWQSDSAATKDRPTTWDADLPPAPAPQPKRADEPLQFRRTAITRQGEWVDAGSSSVLGDGLRAAVETEPAEASESKPSDTSSMEVASKQVDEPVAEFPIDSSSAVPMPEAEDVAEPDPVPAVASNKESSFESTPIAIVDEQVAPIPTEAPPEVAVNDRPRLRLRSGIQQIATEFREESSAAKQRKESPAEVAKTADIASNVSGESEKAVVLNDRPLPSVDVQPSTDDLAGPDGPVQRFPIQRVLQLRQRLESATALNPGASKLESSPASGAKSLPKSTAPVKAAEWEDDAPSSEPAQQVQKVSAEVAPSKRPPLKMRAKLPVTSDFDMETVVNASKVSTATPPSAPKPAVGHSSMTTWVTAGHTATGKAELAKSSNSEFQSDNGGKFIPAGKSTLIDSKSTQPKLEPPVAQVGYEPSTGTSGVDLASLDAKGDSKATAARTDIAPPPPVDQDAAREAEKQAWYEDSLVRRRAVSSASVRPSSFGLIDRLAATLNVPASTVVSLIGGVGFLLIGTGLIAVRTALRKRHSA